MRIITNPLLFCVGQHFWPCTGRHAQMHRVHKHRRDVTHCGRYPIRCGYWLRQNEGTCVFVVSVITLTVFLCWCVWNRASRPVRCGHWLRQNEGMCGFGGSVLTLTVCLKLSVTSCTMWTLATSKRRYVRFWCQCFNFDSVPILVNIEASVAPCVPWILATLKACYCGIIHADGLE